MITHSVETPECLDLALMAAEVYKRWMFYLLFIDELPNLYKL